MSGWANHIEPIEGTRQSEHHASARRCQGRRKIGGEVHDARLGRPGAPRPHPAVPLSRASAAARPCRARRSILLVPDSGSASTKNTRRGWA